MVSTSQGDRELWTLSWARPRGWVEGPEPVRFSLDDSGDVILPPARAKSAVVTVRVAGEQHSAFVDAEQHLVWEPYNIAEEHARLEADHDEARGGAEGPHPRLRRRGYSEERAGLFTEFSRLPVLGEVKDRDAATDAYVAWCNRWGSPGLFTFLYAVAGHRRGVEYIQEKRTGTLLSAREFYARHPEADLGDERFREPAPVEWFSREVALLRHALTLAAAAQSTGEVLEVDVAAARAALSERLTYAGHGLTTSLPDNRQGVYLQSDDVLLARWLWVHASGSRLAFTRELRRGRRPFLVWTFDSFMSALYHLLQEDLTAGQLIRRCADPKCGVFFRPKRGGRYHDTKCRTRVRLTERRARDAAAGQSKTAKQPKGKGTKHER